MWDYQLILFERSLQLTRWKVENLKSNKSSILESVTALTIMISSTPSFLNVANLLRLAILYLKTEASEPWKMINCNAQMPALYLLAACNEISAGANVETNFNREYLLTLFGHYLAKKGCMWLPVWPDFFKLWPFVAVKICPTA